MITVSIVSHGHGVMVENLISQLKNLPSVNQIILTINIPEKFQIRSDEFVTIIQNEFPCGFGENHNNAFKLCTQPFFCVLNPDIEFVDDPFPILLECITKQNLFIASPIIISSSGAIEDNARKFPTLTSLFLKLFFSYEGRWPLDLDNAVNFPDWVAGMFMLFSSKGFKDIEGFDTNYFLYYEDVEICRRVRRHGYQIGLCTKVKAIHDAQRTSRKNFKFFVWHIKSMFRFLFLISKK